MKSNEQEPTFPLDQMLTVLLVDDDPIVRRVVQKTLERLDYAVLAAEHPARALEIVAEHQGQISLLLTDIVMPGMSGTQLAARLLLRMPNLRVLFMSAYTDDEIIRYGLRHDDIDFVEKPFTPGHLASRIREMMGKPGEG